MIHLYGMIKGFSGLIIYFINVRTLKPYQRNLWKDDLSNLEVNNPFEKPAVGFSLSPISRKQYEK